MMDEADSQAFERGVETIRREVAAQLSRLDVRSAEVFHRQDTPMGPVIFSVQANGKAVEAEFVSDEVQNSATAIVHSAATKVAHLVSHFVS